VRVLDTRIGKHGMTVKHAGHALPWHVVESCGYTGNYVVLDAENNVVVKTGSNRELAVSIAALPHWIYKPSALNDKDWKK